jgi:hypothetical protein
MLGWADSRTSSNLSTGLVEYYQDTVKSSELNDR